ncbi:MAG TPA: hypothetical protein VFR28_04890 [Allosphingosinicella sp.]|nr:hypothetical protein [Allosphingosinicella sp.]
MRRALLAAAAIAAAAAAAAPAGAQLRVTKGADLALPVALGPNQGAILVAFRRPDSMSLGKSGIFAFARYDLENRDLLYQPKGAKKAGDMTTYWVEVASSAKKSEVEYHLMVVSAGDYVLYGATPGVKQVMSTFCFGSPTFSVRPGEVVYFGDITPYTNARLADGRKVPAMAYSANPEAARAALAKQAALLAAFRPAELRNQATYSCAGQAMMRYVVPGVAELEPLPPVAEGEAEPATP